MKGNKKLPTPMEKLTAGYEQFIKGRELNSKGGKLFKKVLKKASKPRSAK